MTIAVAGRTVAAYIYVVFHETCRRTLLVRPYGYLVLWDSTFSADREFYFDDQEQMGLGFRVTTPISVQEGGTMLDSYLGLLGALSVAMRYAVGVSCLMPGAPGYTKSQATPAALQCSCSFTPKLEVCVGSR